MRPLLAAAAALAIAASAHAAPQVKAAWSRPAAAGTTGAGFMTIANPGPKADALTSIESPWAQSAMIHETSIKGGMGTMKMLASVPVPAGGRVTFAPGGYHVMFMGLKRPLNMGDRMPATLTFASGARVQTTFVVALAPPAAP